MVLQNTIFVIHMIVNYNTQLRMTNFMKYYSNILKHVTKHLQNFYPNFPISSTVLGYFVCDTPRNIYKMPIEILISPNTNGKIYPINI